MKLIVISSPVAVTNEPATINELFGAGLEIFHLRKPDTPAALMVQLLNQINPKYYSRIALHQHHHLAEQFRIDRLHFPEQERQRLTTSDLEKLQATGYKLSTSVHQPAMIKQLPPVFEYVFLSPVFTSISKPGYEPIIGDDFYLATEDKHLPVIALGGITPENISRLQEMNFNGASGLGIIWERPAHALENFRALQRACNRIFSG